MRTWKVLDYGDVARDAEEIPFDCPHCGTEAKLPVLGRVLAITSHGGLIFDIGNNALPAVIHCRVCRRTFEQEPNVR